MQAFKNNAGPHDSLYLFLIYRAPGVDTASRRIVVYLASWLDAVLVAAPYSVHMDKMSGHWQ